MKKNIIIFASLLIFVGCSKHELPQQQGANTVPSASPQVADTNQTNPKIIGHVDATFNYGDDRATVVRYLQEIHATILEDSPQFIRAEFYTPQMTKHPQEELTFDDHGVLSKAVYIPPEGFHHK